MSDDTFEFIDHGFNGLIDLLEGKDAPIIRVGILGDKNSREGDNGNADIGLKHEYGLSGMPVRSFLRMPLIEKMQEAVNQSGAIDEDTLKKVLRKGTDEWMKKIGVIAEGVIADAFNTGGFGQWKSSNMTYKKNKQTLVETQQLRNSITSVVAKGE